MRLLIIALALVPSLALAAPQMTLKTKSDKISYSIGAEIGKSLKTREVQVNPNAFMRGVNDGLKGDTTLMTPKEMEATLTKFNKEMIEKRNAQIQELAAKNEAKSIAYLSKNKSQPGVVTTKTGLQYKIDKQGTGAAPGPKDTVTVHYRGHLVDGTEFDSSYKRNEPATFGVDQVIPGWTEALQLMTPGAKYTLFIPPELGYGKYGAGPTIGPNEALIFEVELLSVKKAS